MYVHVGTAHMLVGRHDFRNFAKLDPSNVQSTVRELLSFTIDRVGAISPSASLSILNSPATDSAAGLATSSSSSVSLSSSASSIALADRACSLVQRDTLWVMNVTGQAFLWHQVRDAAWQLHTSSELVRSESVD